MPSADYSPLAERVEARRRLRELEARVNANWKADWTPPSKLAEKRDAERRLYELEIRQQMLAGR